jgi:hypothetical protein
MLRLIAVTCRHASRMHDEQHIGGPGYECDDGSGAPGLPELLSVE